MTIIKLRNLYGRVEVLLLDTHAAQAYVTMAYTHEVHLYAIWKLETLGL